MKKHETSHQEIPLNKEPMTPYDPCPICGGNLRLGYGFAWAVDVHCDKCKKKWMIIW